MITIDTATSFFADLGEKCATDSGLITKMTADFISNEPNAVSVLTMLFMAIESHDNLSSAILAIAYFREMERRQLESNKLSDEIG